MLRSVQLEVSPAAAIDAARLSAVITVVFGVALLFLVGFVQLPAVHNGTHDTRHANGFPCH